MLYDHPYASISVRFLEVELLGLNVHAYLMLEPVLELHFLAV